MDQNTTEREYKNAPIVECKIQKSQDGRYIIHKTIFVDIKPIKYYDRVMEKNDAKKPYY